MIEVKRKGDGAAPEFEVVVREKGSESRHTVTLDQRMWHRLTMGHYTPEQFLKSAFAFLLDREPKESILSRFDAAEISHYFPEFETELPRYLEQP